MRNDYTAACKKWVFCCFFSRKTADFTDLFQVPSQYTVVFRIQSTWYSAIQNFCTSHLQLVKGKTKDNVLFPWHLKQLWESPGHKQGKEWNLATHKVKNRTYNGNFDSNASMKTTCKGYIAGATWVVVVTLNKQTSLSVTFSEAFWIHTAP